LACLIALLCFALLVGGACTDKPVSELEGLEGFWQARPKPADGPSDTELSDHEKAMLETLGYLPGYEPGSATSGIAVHDVSRAQAGLNFYTSGHEPSALLMDMKGNVVHRWAYAFDDAFPGLETARSHKWVEFWRRAHLFDNGDVLAIFEDNGLIKLDKNSKLLWSYDGEAHHDLDVAEDGHIYLLTRRRLDMPRIREDTEVYADFVTVLNPEGKLLGAVPLFEAFENSPYASFLKGLEDATDGDIFHTNTVQILDGSQADRSPIFKKGNALISIRNLDVIAIVDMKRGRVVWALSGLWRMQHDPQLLPNGNILVFDNQGHRGMSKVVEVDPLTQEIAWTYQGTKANGFYSAGLGTNQRLANGNTLITESMGGRAFEVTRGGDIVWLFESPHRAGDKDEFVAVLLDLVRLPSDFPREWLATN